MRIVVGMSGGVDSSVAALLLKQQGHEVIGLFMKNWEEKDPLGVCQASKEYEDVVKVCTALDIPHYSVNFTKEYWDEVFAHFLAGLRVGETPNPDILCNREIKFKLFLNKALSLGASHLATGHYAQIDDNGQLLRGMDSQKDQSYFLYTLQTSILKNVLFPIGHLGKKEVRALALKYGLVTAEKKDSTGICFIGERNFKNFLSNYLPYQEGDFETPEGQAVGTHSGTAYYTIGQRKGLNIGGKGEAWFVLGKDMTRNVVIVAQGADHPALYHSSLEARSLSWVGNPPTLPLQCTAKIRYRQADTPCLVTALDENKVHVSFSSPQRAVTPGQSIVFYKGPVCLGGGFIL